MAEVSSSPTVTRDAPAPPVESEQELIVRAQRYEAEALAELFEANFDDLYRYVYGRVGDHTSAEELARQVFVRALDGLPRFRRFETGFAPWLYRIANSLLVKQSRSETAPETAPSEASAAARLRVGLRALTPEQQEVLSLRFIAGLPASTVAGATGQRLSHVLAIQQRGLLALRRWLAPEAGDAG